MRKDRHHGRNHLLQRAIDASDMGSLSAFLKQCNEMGLKTPEVESGAKLYESMQAKLAAKKKRKSDQEKTQSKKPRTADDCVGPARACRPAPEELYPAGSPMAFEMRQCVTYSARPRPQTSRRVASSSSF